MTTTNDLRILWVPPCEPGYLWDITDNPDWRRCNHEILGQLCCAGGGFFQCDFTYVDQAVAQCAPDIGIFLLPNPAQHYVDSPAPDSLEAIADIRRAIYALHERGVPVATVLSDYGGDILHAPTTVAVAYAKLLDNFDAILASTNVMRRAMPYFTNTPTYDWREPSELCLRMLGRPRPDRPRDLIAMVRHAAELPYHARGGTIHNYVVLKALLERFPQYTGFCVGPLGTSDGVETDEYLEHLGIADKVMPPIREFRPWEESIELLSRSKLAIHMEGEDTRSNFLYEAAACGVPIVTTRLPIAAQYLNVGQDTIDEWAIPEAIATGMELLSDETCWERESRRLFAVSKSLDLDMSRHTLHSIIQRYEESRT